MMEVIFVLMVQLLVLIVVRRGVHHTWGRGQGRKKHDIDKHNLDGPDNCGLTDESKLDMEKNDEV